MSIVKFESFKLQARTRAKDLNFTAEIRLKGDTRKSNIYNINLTPIAMIYPEIKSVSVGRVGQVLAMQFFMDPDAGDLKICINSTRRKDGAVTALLNSRAAVEQVFDFLSIKQPDREGAAKVIGLSYNVAEQTLDHLTITVSFQRVIFEK